MRAAAYPGEDPGTVATPEQRMAAYLYFMGPEGKTLAPAAQLSAFQVSQDVPYFLE
jgi:hypothetical protein